jgi:hypothetical protein
VEAASNRFASFFSRVQTEREVLMIINRTFSTEASLHGLTQAAIEQWNNRISRATKAAVPNEVLELLRRISIRADALADKSRIVFAEEPMTSLPIVCLLTQLRELCDEIGTRHR